MSADSVSFSLSLPFFLPLSPHPLIKPKALKRLSRYRCGTRTNGHDWPGRKLRRTGRAAKGRNILKKNKRKRTDGRARGDSARRGGKSRFHSSTRPISRMPPGCVYFVSFYITGYPRDLDSIYFLLALRLECTRPIFDVGGRIFSGRNDRWIFLYFHSRSTVVSFSLRFPRPRPRPRPLTPGSSPSGTLASFNRDIRLYTTANYEPKQHEIRSTRRYEITVDLVSFLHVRKSSCSFRLILSLDYI